MSTDPALMTYQPRFMYVDPHFYDIVKGDVEAWKNPGPMIGEPAASSLASHSALASRDKSFTTSRASPESACWSINFATRGCTWPRHASSANAFRPAFAWQIARQQ